MNLISGCHLLLMLAIERTKVNVGAPLFMKAILIDMIF